MLVLIVDDSPDDRDTVGRTLSRDAGDNVVTVFEAEDGLQALRMLKSVSPDCIILDYGLPGIDGIGVLREIQVRHPNLPVVMITGSGDERLAVTALKGGANDYVSKSDLGNVALVEAVRNAISDKKDQMKIVRRAHFDELTGLPNRSALYDRLAQQIEHVRDGGASFGVALIDLDGFKAVNDLHGHATGDILLRDTAKTLSEGFGPSVFFARIGGDEFVALIPDLPDDACASEMDRILAEATTALTSKIFSFGGTEHRLGLSAGYSLCPEHGFAIDMLMRLADEAMYRVKEHRKRLH